MRLAVTGEPSGGRPRTGSSFRERVAAAAAGAAADSVPVAGLELSFTLRSGHWVDLDTLTETALGGLRDSGLVARGQRGLEVLLATKAVGAPSGLLAHARPAADLLARPVPGAVLLDVTGPALASSPDRRAKRAWRARVEAAWRRRPPVVGDVWAEVVQTGPGSITGGLEALLDVLEPVLGRDPRGRPWQEFFPLDDRIVWLRVRRAASGPARRLRLGSVDAAAGP